MNLPFRFFLVFLILLIGIPQLIAQFSVSAQLRPRMEYRNGYRAPKTANSDNAFFISQRTRLNLGFKNEKIELFISPQDIRVWGDENQLGKNANFSLHEAWGKVKLSETFSVKAGRQELIYDNHRLLGSVDWVQQARSHDALLFSHKQNDFKFDFGGAFNQNSENVFSTDYRPNNYKILSLLHAEKKSEKLTWSGVMINDAFEKSDTDHDLVWRHTLGTLLNYKTGKLGLEGSAYWQGGKTKAERDISAFLITLKAMYKAGKSTLAAGLDLVSGDDPDDTGFQAFNTLYATNHKFYGFMDYFLNVPVDTDGGGLQDYYIQAVFPAGEKSNFKFFYHQFLLAGDVYDSGNPSEFLSKNLGGELDAVFEHNIAAYAKLNLGLSFYFPTATTEQIKGGDEDEINTWGWMMLVLNPELFNSDK